MTSAPKSLKFGTPFPPLSRNIKYWSKDNPLLDGLNWDSIKLRGKPTVNFCERLIYATLCRSC